jgi:ferredoxin
MPIIEFKDDSWECETSTLLRDALRKRGHSAHNGKAKWLNCKGLGSCGSCAVKIEGENLPPLSKMEKWRLNFPPHKMDNNLRLACQVRIESNVKVIKHSGFWGENIPEVD